MWSSIYNVGKETNDNISIKNQVECSEPVSVGGQSLYFLLNSIILKCGFLVGGKKFVDLFGLYLCNFIELFVGRLWL